MPISKLLLSYFLTLIVFLAIDLLWLGLIAKGFYAKHLHNFLSDNVNWTAALIFYALFVVGIFIFAVLPSVDKGSIINAVIYGGLFGFFTYATYDLTNLATLQNWPIKVVIIDILWGVILTATVSVAGYFIVNWLSK